MSLETGTYIDSLVATNPTPGDPKSQGDDHIRLIKATIKATFPNLAGPVTPTPVEMNRLLGVTSDIQSQFDLKAPIASPTLTGTPRAPTATALNNSTQLATTAYVDQATTAAIYPSVAGQAGKVLSNDGLVAEWSSPGGNPNLLINSNFVVNQEGYSAGGAESLTAGEYGHDMWRCNTTAGSEVVYKKETNGDITIVSMTATGANTVGLVQINDEMKDASGEVLTVSLECVALDEELDISFVGAANQTISTTGKFQFTTTADSSGSFSFRHIFSGAGTYTPNFTFRNLKVERGSVVTVYQVPEPRAEEMRGYRYFYKPTAPIENESNVSAVLAGYALDSTPHAETVFTLPVDMRGNPTITPTASGNHVVFSASGSLAVVLSTTPGSERIQRLTFTRTSGTFTGDQPVTIYTSPSLQFDARY